MTDTDLLPPAKKGPQLFGRYIEDIPCFKDSYLYGIWTGLGSGLVAFMFTSRPKVSTHIGFSAFTLTTLSYWTYCRIQWERQVKEAALLKEFMEKQILLEGTTEPSLLKEPEIITVSNA